MKFINTALLALATLSTASAFVPAPAFSGRLANFELEAKKSVEDLGEDDLKGKKVLIRCDVNVPLD